MKEHTKRSSETAGASHHEDKELAWNSPASFGHAVGELHDFGKDDVAGCKAKAAGKGKGRGEGRGATKVS
jgi:hypothetical protein